MVALPDNVFDNFSVFVGLRQHEVASDSLGMLVVFWRFEIVSLFQREKLALAVVDEIPIILQLVLQLVEFFIALDSTVFSCSFSHFLLLHLYLFLNIIEIASSASIAINPVRLKRRLCNLFKIGPLNELGLGTDK